MSEPSEQTELLNKSVVKAARLIRELAVQPSTGATVTTLAKAVQLSRPTAFRLLNSLEQEGLVDRINNNYVLGWELARIGQKAAPYAGLTSRIQPYLDELAEEFNESVTLSAVNSADRLDLVAEASGSHVVGATSAALEHQVGRQYPLHASSSGKVLLANLSIGRVNQLLPQDLEAFTEHTITDKDALLRELDHVREQGYGLIDNELEEGLIALSCPVRDPAGALVAILNLNAPRYRFGRDKLPQALSRLQAAAARISGLLWSDGPER